MSNAELEQTQEFVRLIQELDLVGQYAVLKMTEAARELKAAKKQPRVTAAS